MAETKQKQMQLQTIYLTICLGVGSLLMEMESVSATSILLDGSGNMLQQQQDQQQTDNNIQEHNYIMNQANQSPAAIEPNNLNILEGDGDILKEKSSNEDLTRSRLDFGSPFQTIGMNKRAAGGFIGMRGKKLHTGGFIGMRGKKLYNGGFIGMRGKKMYDDDDDNTENSEEFIYNLPWNQLQNSKEDINWNEYGIANVRRYKKASTGFYGVRGKKFTSMNGVNGNNDNHRWDDFLQKLEEERVREAILQDFVERLAGTKNDVTSDMTKRAPTGFTGVRGKRPSFDEFDTSEETLTKRGLGNNAFVGVRGKKDVSHQTIKRSPAGAEALPGRSGKRQRFVDFNNKFVAVRGKKSSYDDMRAFNSNSNTLSSAAISSLYSKRTPNGFIGMRGKRPFTTGDM